MIQITLKPGRQKSIERRHPWLFSGAILQINGNPKSGDVVDVLDANGQWLGLGYYGMGSIAVRFLSFTKCDICSQDFWNQKIRDAYHRRIATGVVSENTNCWRLVHGEGDGIPGLVLDFYNGVVVFQAHNQGIYRFKELILQAIMEVLGNDVQAVFHRPKDDLAKEDIPDIGFWYGDAEPGIVLENGFRFEANWMHGQKTGFFIDQRENRNLLMRYAKGRKVLNTFCFTGGFSVYAGAAGAQTVTSVDISERAIDMCRKNLELNHLHTFVPQCYAADTFQVLKDRIGEFDLILLDPPSFAKSMRNKSQALKGYRRLNGLAFKALASKGVLFTFSCTQVVDRMSFEAVVYAAAIESGRSVKILHRLGQPPDHAIDLYHPESEYLKGMVLWVE
jgi:23S rRNA (cytosine1962-C5)-methyltransferase